MKCKIGGEGNKRPIKKTERKRDKGETKKQKMNH
jgi:hypothetical protein